jgi:hypothetical protein
MRSETANGFTVVQGGGTQEKIARADVESIQPSKLSLMPEGFENALSPEQMADLLAFVRKSDRPGRGEPELVLRDPISVARLIMDESQPNELREAAISSNPQFAVELIQELARDVDTTNEASRTPWLRRIALAAGKRNDPAQLRNILDLLLPASNGTLKPWQAAVLGGGLIAGLSERVAPRERLPELVEPNEDLRARWKRTLEMAAMMSQDKTIPSEARYDAFRIAAAPESFQSPTSSQQVISPKQ